MLGLALLSVLTLVPRAVPRAQDEIPGRPEQAVRAKPFRDLHQLLPEIGGPVSTIALGDLDGDGDTDAFLGMGLAQFSLWASRNSLLLNDGTGRFLLEKASVPPEVDVTWGVSILDADGDGSPDILLGDVLEGMSLLLNDGRGSLDKAVGAIPAVAGRYFEIEDLDGDGDLDVYSADAQDRLFLNDGTGFFIEAPDRLPVEEELTRSVAAGDVDLDGDPDILLGRGGPFGSPVLLYENTGGFFESVPSRIRGMAPYWELFDADGDGDLDAVSERVLLRNDGAGFFGDDPFGVLTGAPILVTDVDANGSLDYVTQARGLISYVNDGLGKFTPLPSESKFVTTRAVADLDADGDPDVLQSNAFQSSGFTPGDVDFGLALNDGSGAFLDTDRFTEELGDAYITSAVLADVDGDGAPDIVTGSPIDGFGGTTEQKAFLYTNDGAGRFEDRSSLLPIQSTITTDLAAFDAEGDGDTDLFICGDNNSDGGGGGILGLRNDGTRGFEPAYFTPMGPIANSMDTGDVDGDGDTDILGGHGPFVTTFYCDRLLLNDGSGGFEVAAGLPGFTDQTLEVRFLDVDLDGDLDTLHVGDTSRLFVNDGALGFTLAPLPFSRGLDFDIGDVDDDGDTDVLFVEGALHGGRVALYLNDGSGGFAAAPDPIPHPPDDHTAARLFDVDGDTELEALVALGSTRVVLLENNRGTFASAGVMPVGLRMDNPAFGDVDGDGDGDLVAGGRLWSNLARQVAWQTLPRVGKPLSIVVYGPPGTPFVLAVAGDPHAFAFARRGALSFDPAQLRIFTRGTLGPDGRALVKLDVPGLPGLVGATFWWQAQVGNPPRLTNVEEVVLTGL